MSSPKPDTLLFFVNGKKVEERNADPETMLLFYLRDKLRLTGSKSGCGGGACGACTVMVSRYQPRTRTILHFSATACLVPIVQLHGAAVTTVEGIGSTKTRLHPVQERIAKANGSQCGFCTPGMVMSMYTLLRNKPQPSLEDVREALSGNLCRCTGYRPIVDGYRTFCQEANCCQGNGVCRQGNGDCCQGNGDCSLDDGDCRRDNGDCCQSNRDGAEPNFLQEKPQLFEKEDFQPLDPTQEFIFPPELILMGDRDSVPKTLSFCGERTRLLCPGSLEELLELKAKHPEAPLLMGNTHLGPSMKFKGVLHTLMISPIRVQELFEVTHTSEGVWVGAGCSLSELLTLLQKIICESGAERSELFRALTKQLKNLGSQQVRNQASLGGHIMSAFPNSDLNPVLAAGNCKVSVASSSDRRELPLNQDFFVSFGKTLVRPEEVVLSVFIPFTSKGELVSALRHAPRKESAFSTVTCGMRVLFCEGSSVVRDISLYYGGVGPTTVKAAQTCRALINKEWSESVLSRAYDVLLEELELPPSAPGGKVQFRRVLTLTLFFKFHLELLHKLKHMGWISGEVPQRLLPLPSYIQPSVQHFQTVSDSQKSHDAVGRPIMHKAALSQATGEAVYCDDLPSPPGELHLALVTSSRAYANIKQLDVSAALQMPGVVDVITAEDIPGKKVRTDFGYDEDILAQNQVLCVGQMVCAVVADTKAHAKRGAAVVRVQYEDLPDPIFTIEEAIERASFYEPRRSLERGNVTEAFRSVDHIYEGGIRLGGQEHFYMETQSTLVVPLGEEQEFHLYVSTQWPTSTQVAVAETLSIPSNRVVCHVKRLGGAFGGKVTKTAILTSIAAVAAWKTNRAVRCVLERGDDMLITGGRHPVVAKYKVGFMNDGRIIAADLEYFANAGFSVDESLTVVEKMIVQMDNAYNIPHLRGSGAACRTNLRSNTAFRGFGVPQSCMVMENMVTDVAMALAMPADKVRELNMYRGPSLTYHKMEFNAENLHLCWDECKRRSDFEARRRAVELFNKQNQWKKRGVAIVPIRYGIAFSEGFLNQAASLVHIYSDGSVLVAHAGTEMGQGIHTKMQQVASRELHIPISKIYISETSTSSVPNTCPSAASFGTDANGMAVKDACQILYQRLRPVMQKNPEGSWESWVKAAFFDKISLSATGYYRGPDTYMDWEQMEGRPYSYFTYGVCFSEVELDCLTGDYRTLRTDIVMDIGRSINPSVDIGQIEGAFMQGLGLYTLEELKFGPSGLLYTRGPSQYKIPALCDMPLSFNVYLLPDSDNPHAIYSSKGIGEPAVFLGSAVFFAIKDAVSAARSDSGLSGPFSLDSPATAERACLAAASTFTHKVPVCEPGSFKPWALEI
ncbi:unnamed protein product [Knipowitschia caucasica]|uniref:Xanthine dehydrogenase n=1 Tax=Knipowitschia caucasica TaxID=637954 RepID=A0AAV2LAU7_KNICA